MPIDLVPEWSTSRPNGEHVVQRVLERNFTVGDRALVFAGCEYFDGSAHGEYDFIIAIPEVGVAVLEVKDSAVAFADGRWQQLNRKTQEWGYIYPETQLHKNVASVKRALSVRGDFHSGLPPVLGWLVTPDAVFGPDDDTSTLPREQIVDANELENIVEIMKGALEELRVQRFADRDFTSADIARLRARYDIDQPTYSRFVSESSFRSQTIEQLSRDQASLLRVLDDNRRLYVRGGPGTGKSVLAFEQALRLAGEGVKVALLSHNRGLAEFQRLAMQRSHATQKPAFVGNIFDHLVSDLGVRLPEPPQGLRERQGYYNETVPNLMLEFIHRRKSEEKFDAIVIDEAQDLTPLAWKVVLELLRDQRTGIIHAFGDPAQDMWEQHAELPGFWAYGRLQDNLRCTKRIAEFIQAYDPESPSPLSPVAGWHVEVLPVEATENVEAAAMEYAGSLVSEYGWAPGDIAVLSTGSRFEEYKRQRGNSDAELVEYWRTCFNNSSVFYGSTLSFKGLDRPAVVLALNGFLDTGDIASILLVGISRARDQLTIVGTQEDLQRLGNALEEAVPAE